MSIRSSCTSNRARYSAAMALTTLVMVIHATMALGQACFTGWTQPVQVSHTDLLSSEEASLVIDGQGTIQVAWAEKPGGNETGISTRSRTIDDVWGPVVILQPATARDTHPKLVTTGSGRLHIVWNTHRNNNWDVYGSDFLCGGPWSMDVPVSGSGTHDSFVAATSDGLARVHAVWQTDAGGGIILSYRVWSYLSGWGHELAIPTGGSRALQPGIAVDGGGNVYVAFYRDTGRQLTVARREACNGTWQVSVLASGSVVHGFPRIVADGRGEVRVVWSDDRDGSPEIYAAATLGGIWQVPVRLTSDAERSTNPAIEADPFGGLHVVWSDDRDGNSEVYYKYADPTGLWGPDTRLTMDSYASLGPTIDIDGLGGVHLAWQDDRNGTFDIFHMWKCYDLI